VAPTTFGFQPTSAVSTKDFWQQQDSQKGG